MTALRVLGGLFFALGAIGIFVPLLPTTVFWILAAACWARSSPALRARLLAHPRFGEALRHWFEQGAISRRGKLLAAGGMAAGTVLAIALFEPTPPVTALIVGVVGIAAMWVATRPAPETSSGPTA